MHLEMVKKYLNLVENYGIVLPIYIYDILYFFSILSSLQQPDYK